MTATKMRATVQSTTRIATGIAVLDEVLVAFAKAAGARPPLASLRRPEAMPPRLTAPAAAYLPSPVGHGRGVHRPHTI